MSEYRKPTEKETERLNKSRQKMMEGIENEKDIFSKLMPTMAKSARDDIRAAKAMRESVPAKAREGEAYQDAGYKEGGKVSKVLDKAGFYDKGKTKSEREKIVSKVTTKPQRLGMVEKIFSAKKMKSGGAVSSASKRADGCAVKGKTRGKMV